MWQLGGVERLDLRFRSVEIAGLIVCGGASTRMGRDKALLEVEGERLVDRVYARLRTVADPILFATGTPGRLGPLPGPEVADPIPETGPLGAIAAGLAVAPASLLAVAAVDMPFVSGAVFRVLASLRADEDVVVPVDAHGPQVLHSLFAGSAEGPIRRAIEEGRKGVRAVLAGLNVRYVEREGWSEADPSGRFAANVNTPAELDVLFGERSPGRV